MPFTVALLFKCKATGLCSLFGRARIPECSWQPHLSQRVHFCALRSFGPATTDRGTLPLGAAPASPGRIFHFARWLFGFGDLPARLRLQSATESYPRLFSGTAPGSTPLGFPQGAWFNINYWGQPQGVPFNTPFCLPFWSSV